MKMWIVEHTFAWFPVFIRNNAYGLYPARPRHWTWLKRYTRVKQWKYFKNRYRTVDTRLGHINYPIPEGEV